MGKGQAESIHALNTREILSEYHKTFSPESRIFGKVNTFNRRWNLALRFYAYIEKLERNYMPRQAFNSGKGSPMPTFANVRLSEQQKGDFQEWVDKNAKDFLQFQTDLLVEGWKLSIKADLQNACFMVSHTCGAEKHQNYNICLTSRSEDWEEALWMNIYKIRVLFANEKLPTETLKNNWG